jgi:hypothetical protein
MGSKSGQSHPRASVDHFKHMWVRNAHVAEVGVEHGTHAEQLLKRLNIALSGGIAGNLSAGIPCNQTA